MQTIILIILLAFMVVILRTKPAVADVTITAIQYTLDDVTWIGLDGATLEPGYINVAVSWKNNASESIDTLMTLVVEDQGYEPDQEYVSVAPNEEVIVALLMEFIEGERKVTAIIYKEETMTELAKVTVSCTVEEVTPPPPDEAAGHIVAVMADVDGTWTYLDGLTFLLNQTVPLVVNWVSDMKDGESNVKGNITFEAERPDETTFSLTATSGQDSIVEPNGTGLVYFSITFDQALSWDLSIGGTVVIA